MQTVEDIKKVVRDKYAEIVKQAEKKGKSSGCCEPTGCCGSSEIDYSVNLVRNSFYHTFIYFLRNFV